MSFPNELIEPSSNASAELVSTYSNTRTGLPRAAKQKTARVEDKVLETETNRLKQRLRIAQEKCEKAEASLATSRLIRTQIQRLLAKTQNDYQSILEERIRPDIGKTIISADHDFIVRQVEEMFDHTNKFAIQFRRPDLTQNLILSDRAYLVDALTGRDPDFMKMCSSNAAETLTRTEDGPEVILETLLNIFLCKEIVKNPLGFLKYFKDMAEYTASTLEGISKLTDAAHSASSAAWQNNLMRCFLVDENAKGTKLILAKKIGKAKQQWSDDLRNQIWKSSMRLVLLDLKQRKKLQTMQGKIDLLITKAMDLSLLLHTQGCLVKLWAWEKLSSAPNGFDARSNMKAHALSAVKHDGDVNLKNRALDFLVRPELRLVGHDGYMRMYGDGRPLNASIWWFDDRAYDTEPEISVVNHNTKRKRTGSTEDFQDVSKKTSLLDSTGLKTEEEDAEVCTESRKMCSSRKHDSTSSVPDLSDSDHNVGAPDGIQVRVPARQSTTIISQETNKSKPHQFSYEVEIIDVDKNDDNEKKLTGRLQHDIDCNTIGSTVPTAESAIEPIEVEDNNVKKSAEPKHNEQQVSEEYRSANDDRASQMSMTSNPFKSTASSQVQTDSSELSQSSKVDLGE